MRAEFYRKSDSSEPVGYAVWVGDRAEAFSEDDGVQEALQRIFRAAPVATKDASLTSGRPGPVVFQPGSLEWFKWAALTRSVEEGLTVTLVPGVQRAIGWDPAGAYRPLSDHLEHNLLRGVGERPRDEAGEQRPEGMVGPSAPGTEAARPGRTPSAAGPSEQAPSE